MVHTPAAARWSAIIDRHEASGLSIREFAEENDLNPSTLGWWRSKLGRAHAQSRPVGPMPQFVEVEVAGPERTVVIAFDRLNAHVVVDRDTDLELLRQVLEALC